MPRLRIDEGEIGAKRQLKQESAPVDLDRSLSFLDRRAHAGGRQHTPKPISAGANPFDERALRHQLHLQLSHQHLPLRLWLVWLVTIRRTRRASISSPMPTPGRAVSLAINVRSHSCLASRFSSISLRGVPTAMKPPIINVAPSGMAATASANFMVLPTVGPWPQLGGSSS